MAENALRIGFAGDRDIAVGVLSHLLHLGERPVAVILPDASRATHDDCILEQCEAASASPIVIRASELEQPHSIDVLKGLGLDFLICVHFPHVIRRSVLMSAGQGALNLHPAYLPYNRGWHTPSWAILDGTPAGASLHFMTDGLDDGDIVYQEEIAVEPGDTAHSLYLKLKALELRVFVEGWRRIRERCVTRTAQRNGNATFHRRRDLFDPCVQRIELDEFVRASDLLRRLRALTTNRVDEAAYFEAGDRRYRIQVTIIPEENA